MRNDPDRLALSSEWYEPKGINPLVIEQWWDTPERRYPDNPVRTSTHSQFGLDLANGSSS